MDPLKITFEVSGGYVPPGYPLHLDALLAFAETRDSFDSLGEPGSEVTVDALRALGEVLPLARHSQDGEWVWKASALTPVGRIANASRIFTQRRDKADYALRVGRGDVQHGRHTPGAAMKADQFQIDTVRGVHRNLLGYYPIQDTFEPTAEAPYLTLVAYCIGNPVLIERMLTSGRITHLGSRRRAGHGCIERVRVAVDPVASELWMRRVKPWQLLDDDVPIQAAWKAPYWAKENRGQAFCPVSLI